MLAEQIDISRITDDEWCDAIIDSVGKSNYMFQGKQLPGFPEERIQNLTIADGASPRMLKAACKLYTHIKDACTKLDKPIHEDTKILDFGCGWGRIARFFLKEIGVRNIYGVEVLPELVEACSETFKTSNFHIVKQKGTLPFESDHFDVVFANSVFSHLDMSLNMQWFNEIRRVLKPDGIAALTVIDTEKFKSMSNSGSEWFNSLGIDCEDTLEKLLAGEFVWVTTKRTGELDGYGLAFIPIDWIDVNWTKRMRRKAVVQDYTQSIVIMQKTSAADYSLV